MTGNDTRAISAPTIGVATDNFDRRHRDRSRDTQAFSRLLDDI